jgi:phage shock protein PspC (stress-responsive transcriptional regulator)
MQDLTTAADNNSPVEDRTPLPLRGDTILGVCEALGQDFGVPANLLRLAFATLFFWSMPLGVGAYLAVGAVISVARLIYPRISKSAAPEPVAAEAEEREEMQLAA